MVAGRNERIALVLCVAAFCIAMGLRDVVNIWVGTGAAAAWSVSLILTGTSVWSRRRLSSSSLAQFGVGLLAGIAMSVATWALYPLTRGLIPGLDAEVATLYALLRQPPGPVVAFPLLFFVVLAEEVVWRGLAINVFSSSLGPTRAVLAAALLYILPQIAFRSPLLIVVALLCGLVWGILRVRTRGLVAPLTAHVVWDLLVFVMYPLA